MEVSVRFLLISVRFRGEGGVAIFCTELRSLLSKLMFTHTASCTKDYHQKLKVRVSPQITKQFRTYDLRKWETFKAVYLSLHWFNASWILNSTRGFELVTEGFGQVTRGFELVTRGLKLSLLNFWISTRAFDPSTCAFKLSTRNS